MFRGESLIVTASPSCTNGVAEGVVIQVGMFEDNDLEVASNSSMLVWTVKLGDLHGEFFSGTFWADV